MSNGKCNLMSILVRKRDKILSEVLTVLVCIYHVYIKVYCFIMDFTNPLDYQPVAKSVSK